MAGGFEQYVRGDSVVATRHGSLTYRQLHRNVLGERRGGSQSIKGHRDVAEQIRLRVSIDIRAYRQQPRHSEQNHECQLLRGTIAGRYGAVALGRCNLENGKLDIRNYTWYGSIDF